MIATFSRPQVLAVARRWRSEGGQQRQAKDVVFLERGEAQLTVKREELAHLLLAGWRVVDLKGLAINDQSRRPAGEQQAFTGQTNTAGDLRPFFIRFWRRCHARFVAMVRFSGKSGGGQ